MDNCLEKQKYVSNMSNHQIELMHRVFFNIIYKWKWNYQEWFYWGHNVI